MHNSFYIAKLIDHIQNGTDMSLILKYGFMLILLAFVSLFFGGYGRKTCATASCGFAKNLRHDLFYKVQDFSFTNIDKFSTSSLVTRLTTDISNVQMAYMMIIRIAVRSPMMFIFAMIMAFKMCPSYLPFMWRLCPFSLALFLIIKKLCRFSKAYLKVR